MRVTQKSDDEQKAYNYAIRLLTAREYGYEELVDKLCHKFEDEAAYAAVDRCRELGFQSDEREAEMLCRHAALRLAGPKYAYLEAKKRKLDEDLLDPFLEEMDFLDLAVQFLERKYGVDADFSPAGRQKMLASLYRRGFESGTCINALRQFSDNIPE